MRNFGWKTIFCRKGTEKLEVRSQKLEKTEPLINTNGHEFIKRLVYICVHLWLKNRFQKLEKYLITKKNKKKKRKRLKNFDGIYRIKQDEKRKISDTDFAD